MKTTLRCLLLLACLSPAGLFADAEMEGEEFRVSGKKDEGYGESRLDRNVKRFFVSLHRQEDPRHLLEAAY